MSLSTTEQLEITRQAFSIFKHPPVNITADEDGNIHVDSFTIVRIEGGLEQRTINPNRFVKHDGYQLTGTKHYPGSREEPPDWEEVEIGEVTHFNTALGNLIKLWADEAANAVVEAAYLEKMEREADDAASEML